MNHWQASGIIAGVAGVLLLCSVFMTQGSQLHSWVGYVRTIAIGGPCVSLRLVLCTGPAGTVCGGAIQAVPIAVNGASEVGIVRDGIGEGIPGPPILICKGNQELSSYVWQSGVEVCWGDTITHDLDCNYCTLEDSADHKCNVLNSQLCLNRPGQRVHTSQVQTMLMTAELQRTEKTFPS